MIAAIVVALGLRLFLWGPQRQLQKFHSIGIVHAQRQRQFTGRVLVVRSRHPVIHFAEAENVEGLQPRMRLQQLCRLAPVPPPFQIPGGDVQPLAGGGLRLTVVQLNFVDFGNVLSQFVGWLVLRIVGQPVIAIAPQRRQAGHRTLKPLGSGPV